MTSRHGRRFAFVDQLALLRQALRGSGELFVIDDVRNIRAAIEAGLDIVATIDPLTRAQQQELFPTGRPPGALAVARLPRPVRPKAVAAASGDLFVVDRIEGPGNLGAVVRSAAAFGFAGIIVVDAPRRHLYRRATIRAAGPAMFRMPMLTMDVGSLERFLGRNRIDLVGTSPHRGSDCYASGERLAIALGSEARGCSPAIGRLAVGWLRIPTCDATESLNVSAAAAILAHARHTRTSRPAT